MSRIKRKEPNLITYGVHKYWWGVNDCVYRAGPHGKQVPNPMKSWCSHSKVWFETYRFVGIDILNYYVDDEINPSGGSGVIAVVETT